MTETNMEIPNVKLRGNEVGCGLIKATYTLEETANFLGVHIETVRRLIRDRKLRKLPIRHIRISAVELNRFLEEGAR
jgi:excisionase family DNA binding protein